MTLRSANDILGNRMHAVDGDVGQVQDFYFDDQDWRVLYFVIDTGHWLPGRKALVAPFALAEADWVEERFDLQGVTKRMIESGPAIEPHEPVTREQEVAYFGHFGWPCLWQGELRGQQEVIGGRVKATDGELGRVADLLINDLTWMIPYLVVDAAGSSPGRRVLIPHQALERVDWPGLTVRLNIQREQVAGSPKYKPFEPVSRDYEIELYSHYGWEPYWS